MFEDSIQILNDAYCNIMDVKAKAFKEGRMDDVKNWHKTMKDIELAIEVLEQKNNLK